MRTTIVTLISAIALGIVVAAGVFAYTTGAQDRALAAQQAVDVVTSTKEILPGTTLAQAWDDGALQSTRVPSANAPSGFLPVDADRSLIAQTDIPAGQVMLQSAFATDAPYVESISLAPDQVALTVELGDPQRVGTFLRPGSSIAIFNTYEDLDQVARTRLLMSGVSVLAVGNATLSESEDAQVEGAQTALVTVAVDARQAERIVHAVQTGAIYLALLDEDSPPLVTTGVSDSTLYGQETP